jgi:hypothetical protein
MKVCELQKMSYLVTGVQGIYYGHKSQGWILTLVFQPVFLDIPEEGEADHQNLRKMEEVLT